MAPSNFSRTIQAIILAAGKSSRFKTGKTKLLEKICGQEVILYSVKLFQSLNIAQTLVVGFQKEALKDVVERHTSLQEISFVTQDQQLGTGHALACTRATWFADNILIINGDMPLITQEIITTLYDKHVATHAGMSFVIAHNNDPSLQGYGRVIQHQHSIEIVEARNFNGDIDQHCCVNAGIYIIKRTLLEQVLNNLKPNDTTQELYITDLVKILADAGQVISTVNAPFDAIRGINTLQELWTAQQIKRSEIIRHWMEHGVQFSAAQNVHIDLNVTIGTGTYIAAGVHLLGSTSIGEHCKIQEFCCIENSNIGDHCHIKPLTVINNSHIGNHVQIGPFAHIHSKTEIHHQVVIGNFVEVKQSSIGQQSKAKHLSYLGDTHLGSHVNIGAGTITCNHNGITKNTTVIQDNAYIGSNNTLVAPVTIGNNAFTAAGSVITDDVPAHALAFGRARQVNKENYAHKVKKSLASDTPTESENTPSNCQTIV